MSSGITIGQRTGLLTVVRETRHPNRRGRFFICACDCGGERLVYSGHIRNGTAKSCGCLLKDNAKKHGMSHSPEYRSWESALSRCRNTKNRKYPFYGGRGIKMCARWAISFVSFIEDMGLKPTAQHTLDRINSNGDYTPENCRWATTVEQNRNRSFNRIIVFNGRRYCLSELAEVCGVKQATLSSRLDRGWPIERAVIKCHDQ